MPTPQAAESKSPDSAYTVVSLQLSDDGRYVLLSIWEGCDPVNRLWYCDLQKESNGITGKLFKSYVTTLGYPVKKVVCQPCSGLSVSHLSSYHTISVHKNGCALACDRNKEMRLAACIFPADRGQACLLHLLVKRSCVVGRSWGIGL